MGVRLVIGRAGTGKTALCVREIRAAMAEDPLGPPLLWLTPEQGTFTAERLLLVQGGTGRSAGRGTFRAQVLSLRRLALLIARETGVMGEGGGGGAGVGGGEPMDEAARVVLLEEMVRQERGRLSVFATVADRPGFIKKLEATLRELRQHGHTGASLRGLLEGGAAGAMDAVMRRKLLDLAVLLEAWSKVVERPDAWDFEYVMHRAALAMDKSPPPSLIAGARVWVDAISALTALEVRMLVGLGLQARDATITLLADPDAPGIQEMRGTVTGDLESVGLFSRTERLHRRLIDAFRQHGVEIAQRVALREGSRFADRRVKRVEGELLEAESHVKKETPTSMAPAEEDVGGGVEIWESSDPETEVRMVAQAIREMAVGGMSAGADLRYRQIAVIVPELDEGGGGVGGYQDAVRRVFTEHGIPHFIDARRGMAHHPLVEFVRSAVGLVTAHFDRDDMLLFLKAQFAGIPDDDVAMLENYAIEHGITHVPWDQPWTWIAPNQHAEEADEWVPASAHERLARVNDIRERVWGAVREFVGSVTGESSEDGARFARALRQLLVTLDVEKRIGTWREAARAKGNAELAQVHEQVWRQVQRLLAQLETILAGRQRTLVEFERLLATSLEGLTLGLIPPTVDQVLVSSVTRSRVPEMEVVFILGAVEGQFPKVVNEDPILSDAERTAFNAAAADPISEGADRQLLEMPFFDYVALTRARRRLIVSYPLADRQGKALGRSRHVARLRELLGEGVVDRRFDAGSRTHIDRIGTVDDLLAGVASWARRETDRATPARRDGAEGGDDEVALMPAVYDWLVAQTSGDLAAARQQVWRCVEARPVPQLNAALAARFYPPGVPLRMSVSQLEKFAACPLQYFVYYTLGLRPRAEFQLDQLSLGQLQHGILERVYRHIIHRDIAWPECGAAAVRALLEREVDATIAEQHAEIAERTPGYDKTRARLKRVLGLVLEADRRRALVARFRPAAVELVFEKGSGPQRDSRGHWISLPVLPIKAAGGRDVQLRGKIDRMDVAPGARQAVVIDYKSAAEKKMELFRVVPGIALQLPVYALVMRELAGLEPSAALYMALGLARQKLDHEGEAVSTGTDEFFQQFKPRGFVDAAAAGLLDGQLDAEDGGSSAWYKLRFNKDGGPDKRSDLLAHADFLALLDFTRWKIAALVDALAGGKIAPEPYRCGGETPCGYCDYASLCPFDQARGAYREVRREKPDEIFQHMRHLMGSNERSSS